LKKSTAYRCSADQANVQCCGKGLDSVRQGTTNQVLETMTMTVGDHLLKTKFT